MNEKKYTDDDMISFAHDMREQAIVKMGLYHQTGKQAFYKEAHREITKTDINRLMKLRTSKTHWNDNKFWKHNPRTHARGVESGPIVREGIKQARRKIKRG